MVRAGEMFSVVSGSKQLLASPSRIIRFQPSSRASWTPHRIAWALARIGELFPNVFAQIFSTSPLPSLAMVGGA